MDAGRKEGAEIAWRGPVPVSTRFDDPYFSLEDGLAESRHVFLTGNGLPERFRPGFHVAELGFGTGLNALAAWAAWREAGVPGDLRFTSFEAFPLAPGDMRRALATWPEIAALVAMLPEGWRPGSGELRLPGLRLTVIAGDARATLPDWEGRVDAWFLDGFGPAKNPELWEPALMRAVARHTAPGGTFATYSAAGPVRRALAAAGFAVERVQGYGRKRHMTRGILG
jgi:tRNA U34 5-methylaminomethyl-2-thiouridine-forming methyltransferase MnmC